MITLSYVLLMLSLCCLYVCPSACLSCSYDFACISYDALFLSLRILLCCVLCASLIVFCCYYDVLMCSLCVSYDCLMLFFCFLHFLMFAQASSIHDRNGQNGDHMMMSIMIDRTRHGISLSRASTSYSQLTPQLHMTTKGWQTASSVGTIPFWNSAPARLTERVAH